MNKHFDYDIRTDVKNGSMTVTVDISHSPVPLTWEQAASEALDNIGHAEQADPANDLDIIEGLLKDTKSLATGDHYSEFDLVSNLTEIARFARPYVQMTDEQIVAHLAAKQRDYGTGNILAFGLTGLHVRMSDKVARLRNLTNRGSEGTVEPLADAWLDLVGYAVIALMLSNSMFERPLLEDALPWTRQEFMQMLADFGNTVVQEVTS